MSAETIPLPLVWGHRGAMDFAPQNTLPSFLEAVRQGADGVELDVQLTKDGTLAVFHDARVDALTDGRGPLASYRWADLARLDAGRHFGPPWAGTRIPTLAQVLEALPEGFFVNIELKTALSEEPWGPRLAALVRGRLPLGPRERQAARAEAGPLAEATARVLEGLPSSRFLISSFDPAALEAMAALRPDLARGFLVSPTNPYDTAAWAADLDWQAWHPHFSQVNAARAGAQAAAGRPLHVWTVNRPEEARRLAGLGVRALITNRPAEVREALVRG